MIRVLSADELRARCDPASLPFRSTAELEPLDGQLAQQRAMSAATFGIGMRHTGYNLFALGVPATGKTRSLRRLLAERSADAPTPPDWVYVHNFAEPYRPLAIALPPGRGRMLRAAMTQLIAECRQSVPRAFEGEEFDRQRARIMEELARRQQAELHALERDTRAAGFAIVQTPGGFAVSPAPHGAPLDAEGIAALPDAERTALEERTPAVQHRVEAAVRTLRTLERDARANHAKLVETAATNAIQPLVQEVIDDFHDVPGVTDYLEHVARNLLAHAEDFRRLGDGGAPGPAPGDGSFLDLFRVNVLVDRTEQRGAPVVVEENPTFGNLVGRIEHRVHLGTLVTDFTQIVPGALHRANGGYLLLQAKDVLSAFNAWNGLKRALLAKAVRLEDPLDEIRMWSTTTLAPAPIPLDVKVVLFGSPVIYYLLHALDEDFRALFKVKVDFDDSIARTPEHGLLLARFVGDVCRTDGLRHFSAGGVASLLEHASRVVGDQGRLTARIGDLLDLIREASFCAEQVGHTLVEATDVEQAVRQKVYRENLVEEQLARTTDEGVLRIATTGSVVGQVNGLAVLQLGDHRFGRPSRISARTFHGAPGVIDIERIAKLGGRFHSKGVLILSGFLSGRYAREQPLGVTASLTFEQQYSEVDGDSASAGELLALLSSLAHLPLAQSLAITGSVDQHGEIQAIGGVNEKIEGFFDVCATRGLTGTQGVLIPEANVRHLMLRDDVVRAAAAGRFRVIAVSHIDDAIEAFTGIPAGTLDADGTYPEGTVNHAVAATLERAARRRAQHPTNTLHPERAADDDAH